MSSWSDLEVELIVADYFQMLSAQISGTPYNKSEHRKNLIPLLNNRTASSIEFKHQNISAVLARMGQPYIKGYLPRYNFQAILEDKIIEYIINNPSIEQEFKTFSDKQVIPPIKGPNFENSFLVDAPVLNQVSEPIKNYGRNPIKTNYLEREQRNSQLGLLGEELILDYEKWLLAKIGGDRLAKQVRWVSQEDGDGAGYDILSKYADGSDKYIEVKTTKLGKETPFFFSNNELGFSQEHADSYHLYRLFNFEQKAQFFIKQGGLNEICHSTPITYKGYF